MKAPNKRIKLAGRPVTALASRTVELALALANAMAAPVLAAAYPERCGLGEHEDEMSSL